MLLFLARYGKIEVLRFTLLWAALGAGLFLLSPYAVLLPAAALLFTLSFFRDPRRAIPAGERLLISPADGTVTDIIEMDDPDLGPCTRIGIFLSVFNVHVNRVPCAGVVRDIRYVPGKFLDARNPACSKENESNRILIDGGTDGLIAVRQISGAIARRIVCELKPGDRVERGQRFGMIKFGSRTELFVPRARLEGISVKVKDKVRGGETILARTRNETLAAR